jgi:hypothetical protein
MRFEAFVLASALFLSGTIFSLSHITLPSIRTTPAAHYTKLFAPFLTAFSSTSLCYAAYISGRSQLYNAGLFVLGIFPWSAVVIESDPECARGVWRSGEERVGGG